jgi:hypothetical protein
MHFKNHIVLSIAMFLLAAVVVADSEQQQHPHTVILQKRDVVPRWRIEILNAVNEDRRANGLPPVCLSRYDQLFIMSFTHSFL